MGVSVRLILWAPLKNWFHARAISVAEYSLIMQNCLLEIACIYYWSVYPIVLWGKGKHCLDHVPWHHFFWYKHFSVHPTACRRVCGSKCYLRLGMFQVWKNWWFWLNVNKETINMNCFSCNWILEKYNLYVMSVKGYYIRIHLTTWQIHEDRRV